MNDKEIKKAVDEVLTTEYIASIPPHSGDHVFSDEFNNKTQELLKRRGRPYSPFISSSARRAAAVAAAAVIVILVPFVLSRSIGAGLIENDGATSSAAELNHTAKDASSAQRQESKGESSADNMIWTSSSEDTHDTSRSDSDTDASPTDPSNNGSDTAAPSVDPYSSYSYPDIGGQPTDSLPPEHDIGEKDSDSAPSHEEQLRDRILSDWESLPIELLEFSEEENKEKIAVYRLNSIPAGYRLSSVRNTRMFLTYDYINENDGSLITFVWGYLTEGDEYLKNAVDIFELIPLPGYEGYFYSEAADDTATEIYQIYWSEDGYCFQLNIPRVYITGTDEAPAEEKYDLSVSKSYYDAE